MTEKNKNETLPSMADIEQLIPGVMYFDIPDPLTGRLIGPDNPNYFAVKKQLGGDAGEVASNKSTACAPIIDEWRKKQAKKH